MRVSGRTIVLMALAAACVFALAPGTGSSAVRRGSALQPRPHALKLFINGKRMQGERLVGGADDYKDIAAGRLRMEARWLTNARGTGYRVVIATTEPYAKDWATCSVGTRCRVGRTASILPGQEMSWTVTIRKKRNNAVVGGFRVCLFGKA